MQISDKALDEFIQICREEYGVHYSREEAVTKAMQFLLFCRRIYQPLPVEIEAMRLRREAGASRDLPPAEAA